jgi:hypothetical protein
MHVLYLHLRIRRATNRRSAISGVTQLAILYYHVTPLIDTTETMSQTRLISRPEYIISRVYFQGNTGIV